MNKTAAYMPADLNRLERETGMLLATVESLSEDEMRAPSLCEGWTRAHVVAHMIGLAGGLGNLVTWAVTGTETPMYSCPEDRDAQIEDLAKMSAAELKQELREATAGFQALAGQLRNTKLATEEVSLPSGPFNAYAIPALWTTEVLVHHNDLDTLWKLDEGDMDALEDALELAMAKLSKRDDWPGLTVITDEGENYTIGDGATTLKGGRDAIIGWVTRGLTDGLRYEGELPERPKYA
ncbi:maleylpyruvate isomerase family mycothiol-dependent enzyme [Ammonicoccus fulvus]|uniref:Maleylpyruvate isomerase family mycothiol-dependent enzyme n=1 Tax=Ammonicoccus fulvus TaxID=3138240 RepID=A0ABZ3FP16_9ACTN